MRGALFSVLLVGCGGEAIQRAVVTAPQEARSPNAFDNRPPLVAERTWLVTPDHTRFEVRADSMIGEQRFSFRRYRARVATNGLDASFHATIDVGSLEGPFASMVRDRLLEADRFPEATFDGTARRDATSTTCTVDGRLDIHGITKQLHFQGTVREGRGYLHIHARFEVPRKEFDIAFHTSWDTFLPDNVQVLLDIDARPELVNAEPLPDVTPSISPTGE